MKILQVNCVYNTGSTGKIVADIHQELVKSGVESVVCYGRGAKTTEPNIYKTCGELYSKANNLRSRITGLMYGGCCFSTRRIISIIKQEKPDIVHLHCINGYFVNIYRLIEFLKANHIKTVLTLHAEFMYTANCGHALDCDKWQTGCGKCPRLRKETKSWLFDRTDASWQKMKAAFDGFDNLIVTSVSPWLMERAAQSPILSDKQHCVVLNGLDTSVFHVQDSTELRKLHRLENAKVVFHVTPYFSCDPLHLKGGYYVLQLAERLKAQKNIKIIVAGDYSSDVKIPDNVIMLGRVSDQNVLAQYYSMADVMVLTSKKETFSMVCAESLCCGTPVVGFKAGAPEQIALSEYSSFVEYGDIEALESAVKQLLLSSVSPSCVEQEAAHAYAKQTMVEEYRKVYQVLAL